MREIPEHILIAAKDLCEYMPPSALADLVDYWSSEPEYLPLAQIAFKAGYMNCGAGDKEMNEKEFEMMTGRKPEQDDLERVNCPVAGKVGHRQCGVCIKHNQPRFVCGCVLQKRLNENTHFYCTSNPNSSSSASTSVSTTTTS